MTWQQKNVNPIVTCSWEAENSTLHLFLYHNLISRCLKTTHVIIKMPNKRELRQIASNHSSDIEFKVFMDLYKD